jgi:hypothetical protein
MKAMKARLSGTIKLVEGVDTIGIPVLSEIGGNRTFVPETDADLRISKFCDFYNEDGYRISNDTPADFRAVVFEEGMSVPIPFWIDGKSYIIIGDADKEETQKLFGNRAKSNPVLRDIARLLDDARSGRIQQRFDEWAAESLAASYADVFYEVPSRSRYWVSRYRVAVAEARKLATPPHPIDAKLRTVASEWLRSFGSKTDIRKLIGIMGNPSSELFTRRQICDVLFAFLLNRYLGGQYDDIDVYLDEPVLHGLLPAGLHGHYLEHGWPRVPFRYKQDRDFIKHAMDELVDANERHYYARAAKVIFLLFGRAELPPQIDEMARVYLYNDGLEFNALVREWESGVIGYYESRFELAKEILRVFDQMLEVDSIVTGKERLRRKPMDGRFGATTKLLNELREVTKIGRL